MASFAIADDNRIARDFVTQCLVSTGHRVVGQAKDGQELINLCRRYVPDFVITDVTMQPMPGNVAARIIVEERLAGKVFVMTSVPNPQIMKPLEAIGCVSWTKPISDKAVLVMRLAPHLPVS